MGKTLKLLITITVFMIISCGSAFAGSWVDVRAFGAVGDGVTDDTAAIQAAIDYSAANQLELKLQPGKTYNVTSLQIRDNLCLNGNNATIKCVEYGVRYVIGTLSIGPAWGTSSFVSVNNVTIQNLIIDSNGNSMDGLDIAGNKNVIKNVYVYGLNNPAISYYGIRICAGSDDCLVDHCRVDLDLDIPVGKYSGLSGIATTGVSVDTAGGLRTHDEVQDNIVSNTNIRITNNVIYGGTHGLGVIASYHCAITDNRVTYSTHRCIAVSQRSCHNVISRNDIRQFGSSGVHLYGGSDDNIVSDNKVFSDGSFKPYNFGGGGGEAALQCYLHCKNNKFLNNIVNTASTNYAFYSAIHCDGLIVEGNTFQGGYRSVIGIESDWLPRPLLSNQVYSRINFGEVDIRHTGWTSWNNGKGFSSITIKNNKIIRDNKIGNCGIYIAQIGDALLQNIVIDNNTINSDNPLGHSIYVSATDSSKFSGSMINNNFNPIDHQRIHLDPGITFNDYRDNRW